MFEAFNSYILSSNIKFKWTKVNQKSFKNIKLVMAHNTLLD